MMIVENVSAGDMKVLQDFYETKAVLVINELQSVKRLDGTYELEIVIAKPRFAGDQI
jgi:hypothetical protein